MLADAEQKGDNAAIDNIVHASALLESANQVAPNMVKAVKAQLGLQ